MRPEELGRPQAGPLLPWRLAVRQPGPEDNEGQRGSWREPAATDILEQAPRTIHRGLQASWPPTGRKKGPAGPVWLGAGLGPTGLAAAHSLPQHRGLRKAGPAEEAELHSQADTAGQNPGHTEAPA